MQKVTSASSSSPHAPGEPADDLRRVGVEGGGAPAGGDGARGCMPGEPTAGGGGTGPGALTRAAAWMVAFCLSNSSCEGAAGKRRGGGVRSGAE
eukprot:scaffold9278_cov117-Isochrysis_galbana.AAC.1